MDAKGRKARKAAWAVGLDLTGPYTGGNYCIWEFGTGELLSPPEGVPFDMAVGEIEKHQGVSRLAEARLRHLRQR